jgi:hypothetical protein
MRDSHASGDRADVASRLAELVVWIEAFKHPGHDDSSAARDRRWSDMPEEAKLGEIMHRVRELHLESEAAAYAVVSREVEIRRVGRAQWWEFEEARRNAYPKPVGEREAFDEVVSNLPGQWQQDGHGGGVVSWNDLYAWEQIAYQAEYAAKHDVAFEHFVEAARHTLGMTSAQEFTADDYWHLRMDFSGAHRLDYKDRATIQWTWDGIRTVIYPYPSVKHPVQPVPSPEKLAGEWQTILRAMGGWPDGEALSDQEQAQLVIREIDALPPADVVAKPRMTSPGDLAERRDAADMPRAGHGPSRGRGR